VSAGGHPGADGGTPERTPDSKAGRNEARKLAATFLNNVGVGFFLAGLLQPALAVLRDGGPITGGVVLSAFLLSVVGLIFGAAGQRNARRLAD